MTSIDLHDPENKTSGDDEESQFFAWLRTEYPDVRIHIRALGNGLFGMAKPLMFHWTIILGSIGDRTFTLDRWCYAREEDAKAALVEWDGAGDPPGPWHRHPLSGRRRPDGDAEREYIAR